MLRGKNKLSMIALALGVLLGCCNAPSQARDNSGSYANYAYTYQQLGNQDAVAIAAYNSGTENFRLGRTADAIKCFRTALQIDPTLMIAHGPLGQLLFRAGSYEDAFCELSTAVQCDQTSASNWCILGVTAARLHRFDIAAPALQRYIALDPNGGYAAEARRSLSILTGYNPALSGVVPASATEVSSAASPSPRWADSAVPLKVFVANGTGVAGFSPAFYDTFSRALANWTEVSEGHVRFMFVNDPSEAQITCSWTANPKDLKGAGELGITELAVNRSGWIQHADIKLLTQFTDTRTWNDIENRTLAVDLHEIGHALGLSHSGQPQDVMYPMVAPLGLEFPPSQSDKNTLLVLYPAKNDKISFAR